MSAWFDTPNPTPKRRRPMAELLVELADRNGDPVWPARLVVPTATQDAIAALAEEAMA